MRQLLTDRYRERVAGVISCYDRICYAKGMTAFLSARQIRIFDYPRFAEPLRDRVRERAAEVEIRLENARVPGTLLSADFTCVLKPRTIFGTPMELKFVLGGFDAHTNLERWLVGQALVESAVAFNTDVSALGATSKLALAGQAEARYFPNWLFQITGSDRPPSTLNRPSCPHWPIVGSTGERSFAQSAAHAN